MAINKRRVLRALVPIFARAKQDGFVTVSSLVELATTFLPEEVTQKLRTIQEKDGLIAYIGEEMGLSDLEIVAIEEQTKDIQLVNDIVNALNTVDTSSCREEVVIDSPGNEDLVFKSKKF